MTTQSERLKREAHDTAELTRQVLELGIDVPSPSGWWWDDSEDFIGTVRADQLEYVVSYYLTEQGKAGYRKLIREERESLKEERARIIDRRIRWACQIIAAITGLAGAAIGILAMLRK
jgi:hypothetical protein